MALCNITGTLYYPNGEPARTREVWFHRAPESVAADYLGTVLPDDTRTRSAYDGSVDFNLITGYYIGEYKGTHGRVTFKLTVPESASAQLEDCIAAVDPVEPMPVWLAQIIAEREAAEAARDEAEAAGIAAQAAADASIQAGQWDQEVADEAARLALSGLATNWQVYQLDTERVWRWDGAAWVDRGESPLALKAPLSALVGVSKAGESVSAGAAVTDIGGMFVAPSSGKLGLYTVDGNLFDPAKVRDGKGLNSTYGMIQTLSGFGVSDFIPVRAGDTLYLSANAELRQGYSFFTSKDDSAVVPGSYVASSGGLITVPAGASFLVFNTKSGTIPQPSQIMLNRGGTALPYAPYGSNSASLVVEGASQASMDAVEQSTADIDGGIAAVQKNLLPADWKYDTDLALRSISAIVSVTQADLLARGFSQCVQWPNSTQFAIANPGETLNGKYVFGCFYAYSENPANFPSSGSLCRVWPNTLSQLVSDTFGHIELTPRLRLVWMAGLVNDPTADTLLVGRSSIPVQNTTFFGTGLQAYIGDTPFNGVAMARSVLLQDHTRADVAARVAAATPPSPSEMAEVNLLGSGLAQVWSDRSGKRVQNVLNVFPAFNLLTAPVRCNIGAVYLEGVQVRSPTDDSAPDHVYGTTLGANHGYQLGVCTATAHGKTVADEGSRWVSGGVAVVLVKVQNANALLIAREVDNTAPPTGTYTHVSGATNTGNISVSAVTQSQWFPPHTNRQVYISVDGVPVGNTPANQSYQKDVSITETVEALPRADIIAWWIANGGASGGNEPDGTPYMSQTVTHSYDRYGQMTVGSQWTFLDEVPVQDLMGLQVQRLNTPSAYVIPGSLPFTYDGDTLDYSLGVSPARTMSASGTPSVWFGSARLQAEGEYAHRLITVYDDYVFAVGLLPVGDAAYDVRRARVSNYAMEIRGDTGKVYFRVLDTGTHTSEIGDSYSAVGYRNIMAKSPDRLTFYSARSGNDIWVFADWIDKAGLDRLPIAQEYPDLIGRSFEVIEARNCSVKAGVLGGSLPVIVDAEDAAAALILRVK